MNCVFSALADPFRQTFEAACCLPADAIHIKPTTGSTNADAKTLASVGSGNAVILAGGQTAGRGRLGRSFYSPDGSGLYTSVLLHPRTDPEQIVFFTVAAAVFAAEALETAFSLHLGIKWVNDLYFNHRKVGGILSESGFCGSAQPSYTVVGMGLNLCDPAGGFPSEIEHKAGSLFGEQVPDASVLAGAMAETINRLMAFSLHPDPQDVLPSYRRHSLLDGQTVTFERDGSLLQGTVCGIDDDAHLMIRQGDGKRLILRAGEVSVKPMGDCF